MKARKNGKWDVSHRFWVSLALVIFDTFAVNAAYFLALWMRYDFRLSAIIGGAYFSAWLRFLPIYTVISIIVFYLFKLYHSLWRFASYVEVFRALCATILAALIHTIGITVFFQRMPLTYYFLGALFQVILVLGARVSVRFVNLLDSVRSKKRERDAAKVMIVGAGAAGHMLLRDIMHSSELNEKVCCFIDDDPEKWGCYIDGVPIVGGRNDILLNVKKYAIDRIYVAIPSASAAERRDILNICKETDCQLKNLPGLYQLASGEVSVSALKEVSIEDLLGREQIRPDLNEVREFLTGKTIMVTGGGGSIGSELCRQIASYAPRQLIILDIYENNAYDIQLELKDKYPELDIVVLIGSVRDSRRMFQIFDEYRPQIVYHAAAHKHVPLMEDSPCEAIKNNTIGTYKTAYAAMVYGCERFVLVSTDKAVNPTNIMGASKRLCEMIVQAFSAKIREGKADEIPPLFTHGEDEEGFDKRTNRARLKDAHTEFAAVRFGNVLGSNGSVVPIFRRQIEKGGPVTVTHPDIIRYFMTIPEATSLVLLAGTYAKGGEIFVLNMGNPVRIDTLARNLIRLSGLKPDVDIMIEYTGLRPGEKLYEERLMDEEGLRSTANDKINIGKPIPFDTDAFLQQLDGLLYAAYNNQASIRDYVSDMVSTYHPEGCQGPIPAEYVHEEEMFAKIG